MRKFLFAFFMLYGCSWFNLRAQVSVVPLPNQEGYFMLDDLWKVNLINPLPSPLEVYLDITLEDAQHQPVLTATSAAFTLRQGSSRPPISRHGNRLQYSSTAAAATLRNIGRLPYGQYIVCYKIVQADKGTLLGQHCQEQQIKPFGPPELISPYNREAIRTIFPVLTWKAPYPAGAIPFTYSLRLTEVKPGQTALQALEGNVPLLSRRIEQIQHLLYPGDAPRLEVGKKYVWQISAQAGDFNLGATEIWVFTIGENETPESVGNTYNYETYYDLKLTPSGGYLPSHKFLRFRYDNRFGSANLPYVQGTEVAYEIYTAGNRSAPIAGMPVMPLNSGVNKISIPLNNNPNMQNGEDYLLVVKDTAGGIYYLDFIYYSN